jgi:hypothetical protein
MTKQEIAAVLDRVLEWPKDRQEDLLAVMEQIEADMAGGRGVYEATPEELAAIDEGIAAADAGDFATEEEVAATLAKFRGR